MPLFRDVAYHPRRLWLRRAGFQVHLWAGVLLSLYLIAIALSGAVLVWEDELTRIALPVGMSRFARGNVADASGVVGRFTAAYPGGAISNLVWPSEAIPAFQVTATDVAHRRLLLVGDPVSGALHVQGRTTVAVVHDLHVNLLLGQELGLRLNGIGAAVLLLLAISGLVLWWPGVRVWMRGLRVSFGHNWRRINYDLHSAIGFWTLLIVVWWAFSGVYFTWYRQVAAVINAVSPLRGMVAPGDPMGVPPANPAHRASLDELLAAAQAASPRGEVYSVSDPLLREPVTYVLMDLREPGDFSHRDIVRVRTADARPLTVWHYGENHSAGDWILWAMHPLHFGTLWGWPVKVVWCGLGVSLAALTATGLLMYWNRWLRHRWRALNARTEAERPVAV